MCLPLLIAGLLGCSPGGEEEPVVEDEDGLPPPSVLVFSKTAGWRHDSIEPGVQALTDLAGTRGWHLESTEDASVFSADRLDGFDVVLFLNTTRDVLDEEQQAAMERFVAAGKGYVGVHSASDTEYDWPWYGGLVGAYFEAHPAVQSATVVVEDGAHPATAHLDETWTRTDEWYGFQSNPRNDVHVLLSLDEGSYSPGSSAMEGDHPIAWYHEHGGGRSFYTALGHTRESYQEPAFLDHLEGGLLWAIGRAE